MVVKKILVGTVLCSSILLSSWSLADLKQPKAAYWGASGAAYCYNYENISIWVGMSYARRNEALTELWTQAVSACQYKGGLYDVSGTVYSHQGPYW
ncbi:MAG: hypothetical protein D3910_08265 [Candidatus Electrothrix sp. ATG2]|nr:hypothetical protein [Candidatus Electrothrix sp. ATG2]